MFGALPKSLERTALVQTTLLLAILIAQVGAIPALALGSLCLALLLSYFCTSPWLKRLLLCCSALGFWLVTLGVEPHITYVLLSLGLFLLSLYRLRANLLVTGTVALCFIGLSLMAGILLMSGENLTGAALVRFAFGMSAVVAVLSLPGPALWTLQPLQEPADFSDLPGDDRFEKLHGISFVLLGLAQRLKPDSLFTKARIVCIGAPYVSELFLMCLYQKYRSPKILHAFDGYLGIELQETIKNKIMK